MDIKESLLKYKSKLDPEIEKFFEEAIEQAKKEDKLITQAVEHVRKIVLSGGKRLRPALMYYGYVAAGGKMRKEMIKVSVSMELIHMFLLIHDDVIDRDYKRHSVDTLNYKYKKIGQRYFDDELEAEHFGNSMAVIIGDLVGAAGSKIIFDSKFDNAAIMKALSKLQGIIARTVVGQAKDIYIEVTKSVSEKEVLNMYEYKTARYTVEGPLHVGASLAGADDEFLKQLTEFAIPTGIAFQIQDDILGIYGSEKKLGKPVGSDIKEGKYTLLVIHALKNANEQQEKIILGLLGRKDIKLKDVQKFRKVLEDTGALAYAQKMASDYVQQGNNILEKMEMKKESKEFLIGLADYMINRKI